MDRSSKTEFVQTFNEKVSRARLAIVADYQGIDVNTLTAFRKQLSTEDAEFAVVKNRLMMRAVEGTTFESITEFLSGPNAVLLGFEGVVEAAKVLTEFAKKNEALELKGGVLDGKPVNVDQIKALADLPSKEVLQAMLLGVLQGPSRNLVSLLANCNRQLLNVLVAYKDKLEEDAA
jgi:large subunit ribosomal protein L10